MNAKEYLAQAFCLDQRINSKLEQVVALREIAAKTIASYSSYRVEGTKQRSPMENALVKLIDLENEIDADIDRLVDLKRELQAFISNIENPSYRILLEFRYLAGNKWEEVAEFMEFDIRWIHRLHNKALREVEILLGNSPSIRIMNL